MIEVRDFISGSVKLFLLEYRPPNHPDGFSVQAPMVTRRGPSVGMSAAEQEESAARFLEGLMKHPSAGPLWASAYRRAAGQGPANDMNGRRSWMIQSATV